MLRSQKGRIVAPEMDSLRLASGWKREDLSKVQIFVGGTFGQGGPGSVHLQKLMDNTCNAIYEKGGIGAKYFVSDLCDGEIQGGDGMNYSLPSREFIANMWEIQCEATPFDGAVYTASCDKGIPSCLMAMARMNIPGIFVPGGAMKHGPNMLTAEMVGMYSAMMERGEINREEFNKYSEEACPSCGACQFLGTANTMQIMAEALGLALPGSSAMPAVGEFTKENSIQAGYKIIELVDKDIKPSDILTREAFENAIVVHAAIAGSTNALLHLPAIAHELGIILDMEIFDEINRKVPYILNVKPSGEFPIEYFAYGGGLPALQEILRPYLNLDVMTVTGKTLRENLSELKSSSYYHKLEENYRKSNITKDMIFFSRKNPINAQGSIGILKGNLAEEGAVIKHSAVPIEMQNTVLKAKTFDSEEEALDSVLHGKIHKGDAVIIRYEGPKGSGMPEMFLTTEAIASDEELSKGIALITDGRFSGASRGPCIGHVSPEAAEGGNIALVEDGDLIEISLEHRTLNIIGIKGERKSPTEVENTLKLRRKDFVKPERKFKKGALGIYTKLAVTAMKGGYMEV